MNEAIARLGIIAETRDVRRGADDLGRFGREARTTAQQTSQAGRGIENMQRQMRGLSSVVTGLVGQFAALLSVWSLIRANDAWVSANNQLRLVTQSSQELLAVQREVFGLSQRTASSFESMAGLFAAIERAAGDAIGSQTEVLRLTETIAKLASASGGPASSRNSALFQLRQMLQGSVVQAQEFNSLIDGTPLLVQAIADSLGVTRAELRGMVLDGNLAVSTVINALREQADEADALFARVNFTVSDAIVRLQNAFQQLVGTNLGPLFAGLVELISRFAENIGSIIPLIAGLGVAFTIHFAGPALAALGSVLTSMTALRGALAATWALIAANPLAIVVGTLTAAALAVDRFGDSLTVAQVGIERLSSTAEDSASTVETEFVKLDVSIRDVFVGLFVVVGGELRRIADSVADLFSSVRDENEKTIDEMKAAWYEFGGSLDQEIEAVGNELIRAAQMAGYIFSNLWEAIALGAEAAFRRVVNAASSGIEDAANAARGWLPFTDSIPEVRLGRLDTSNVDSRISDWENRYNSFEESIANTDYMGDFRRRVMGAAADSASSRLGSGSVVADPAAAAAAAAAARATAELQKQADLREQMFHDAQAQIDLSEREFEIYQLTENLLDKFPEYYAQQAAGATDLLEATRSLAEEDARRLDALQRQARALAQQRTLDQNNLEQQRLRDALVIGQDEYEILERTYELMDKYPDLYDRMTEGSEQRARSEAQTQLALERQTEELSRQAERVRELQDAPVQNFIEGLENASDSFWDSFVNEGFSAIGDIGDELERVFRQLQADILRSLFDPILASIRNGATQSVSSIFGLPMPGGGISLQGTGGAGGGFGNIGGLFNSIGGIFGGGKSGAGGGGFGGFAGLGSLFGGGGVDAAGNAIGGLSGILGSAGQIFGASMIGSSVAQLFGLGGGTGGNIGGVVGGIAGSIFGPIGSAVGSFIGSAIGGMFNDEEREWAYRDLGSNRAMGSAYGSKSSAETRQVVTAISDRILEGQDLIRQLGGTMERYVSFVQFAGNAVGQYALSNAPDTYLKGGASGDPDSLVSAALEDVLNSTTFANPIIEKVASALELADTGFEDTLQALANVSDLLPKVEETTSKWSESLDQLKTTFDGLKQSTEDVYGAAHKLNRAFSEIVAEMQTQFDKGIADQITAIQNPIKSQLEGLLETQARRIEDANILGTDWTKYVRQNGDLMSWYQQNGDSSGFSSEADYGLWHYMNYGAGEGRQLGAFQSDTMAQVLELNSLELQRFIQNAGSSAAAFSELREVFDELVAAAEAAGTNTQPLVDAFEQARQGVVDAFDSDIQSTMEQLANPTLAAFKRLLEQQAERLETATEIGGNIVSVERLNALEQQKFFENLNDQQRSQMAVMLGLAEDFTGRTTLVLGSLLDEINARVDETEQLRTDALQRSERFQGFADNFNSLRQDIEDRYGAATPGAQLSSLRERLLTLAGEGQAGNESALTALPQVAQQIISLSRDLYGSTTTFRSDFDLVQGVLRDLGLSTQTAADVAAQEAETLAQQRDLLVEIRDLLGQPDPAFEALSYALYNLNEGNDSIANLLGEYLILAQANASQFVSDPALLAAALEQAQQSLVSGAGVINAVSGSSSDQLQTQQQMLGVQTALVDLTESGFVALTQEVKLLRRDLSTVFLNQSLGATG